MLHRVASAQRVLRPNLEFITHRLVRSTFTMASTKKIKSDGNFVLHDNTRLFTPEDVSEDQKQKTALLILNNPKGLSGTLVNCLWSKSFKRICADGGSNWLYDSFNGKMIPDVVHGDLDSMRPEVGEYFRSKGAEVSADKRDDATDMDKCLSIIRSLPGSEEFTVFVAGIFGSRFDHEMGNLNCAFRHRSFFKRLILISAETYGELLPGGETHRILPDRKREGPICGMIPLFGPCEKVDTEGLRWNMEGRGSHFGGLVSTSNEIASDVIEITSDGTLLWTTTLDLESAC